MSSDNKRQVTLEEMIALNDEIVSLVRAGVPLELGLQEMGAEQAGALGKITTVLAVRMSRGQTLSEALAAEGNSFPRIYSVTVEAGLKSGRLTAALEGLTRFGSELVDLRRRIGLALVYPLIVFSLAYALFLVFVVHLSQWLEQAYWAFRLPAKSWPLQMLIELRQTIAFWAWIPPLIVFVVIGWWLSTGRARVLDFSGPGRLFTLIPGMRRIRANHQFAGFSSMLALMVEHGVPLNDGVLLAAEVTGDRTLMDSARQMTESVSAGNGMNDTGTGRSAFPPFLRWLILRSPSQESFAKSLRLAGDMYRRRALYQAEWLKLSFPIIAGIGIGGGATFVYALALFLPLSEMLQALAS